MSGTEVLRNGERIYKFASEIRHFHPEPSRALKKSTNPWKLRKNTFIERIPATNVGDEKCPERSYSQKTALKLAKILREEKNPTTEIHQPKASQKYKIFRVA